MNKNIIDLYRQGSSIDDLIQDQDIINFIASEINVDEQQHFIKQLILEILVNNGEKIRFKDIYSLGSNDYLKSYFQKYSISLNFNDLTYIIDNPIDYSIYNQIRIIESSNLDPDEWLFILNSSLVNKYAHSYSHLIYNHILSTESFLSEDLLISITKIIAQHSFYTHSFTLDLLKKNKGIPKVYIEILLSKNLDFIFDVMYNTELNKSLFNPLLILIFHLYEPNILNGSNLRYGKEINKLKNLLLKLNFKECKNEK